MSGSCQTIFNGDRFLVSGGWCTVINYDSSSSIDVKFDLTGSIRSTNSSRLKAGILADLDAPSTVRVGYMGNGLYSWSSHPQYYQLWSGMIKRCYEPRFPSYAGCSVHESWHSFQNFCRDVENMKKEDGWQLDKDLLIDGNKIYSKDACVFLPRVLNSQFLTKTPRDLPEGVTSRTKKTTRYQAILNVQGKNVYLGWYSTVEEAEAAYKVAKLERLLFLADLFKGRIEDRAYNAFVAKSKEKYGTF